MQGQPLNIIKTPIIMPSKDTKNKKLAGMQIHQLFTLEYVNKILQSEQPPNKKSRINQKRDSCLLQYRYTSEFQKYLSLPFQQRTAKIIKISKNLMRDFDCFSAEKSNKGNYPQNSQKNHQSQIIKQDIESLISVFAMYSEIAYYSKGQIIDTTGRKNQKIRILLKGELDIYEPTNRTSLTNCIHKIKESQNRSQNPVCALFNTLALKISDESFQPNITDWQFIKRSSKNLQNEDQKLVINEKLIYGMLGPSNKQKLSHQNCNQILNLCQIISPMTPHKHTTVVSKQGALIVPLSKSSSILGQAIDSQASFTVICISSEAVVIELEFVIYREILWLIKKDKEKLYISCLMKKFESLGYFEAQCYVKKKQNIIDYLASKDKNPNQSFKDQSLQNNSPLIDQNFPHHNIEGDKLSIEDRKESLSFNKIQSLQNESSSLYFTIPYTKIPYLIVEGQVTIVINRVKQQRLIDQKYSLPRKTYTRHQLIKLYQNDVFGVEAIGEQTQFSLRYEVRKDSKILKMSKNILKNQIKQIPGFQIEFNNFSSKRDSLLREILHKLSRQIQNQMIQKYTDHSYKSNRTEAKQEKTKMINYQKDEEYKNTEAEQIFLNQSNKQLMRRQFSLPIMQKPFRKNDIGQFSEDSQSKSKVIPLTERKRQEQRPSLASKITDVQYVGSKKYPQLKRELLEKLSLKQRKRYSAHNQKRLTVELLKEFNLVGFSEEATNQGSGNGAQHVFVEMRDPVTGILLRRRSIPSIEQIQMSKNRQNIEKVIMRKIGLLTETEKVSHNEKVVKSRRSQIQYENLDEMRRKQRKRLHKISKSLPRLQNFYSKQADIQYKNKNTNKILL